MPANLYYQSASSAIGVFDSGVGGLSVMRHIQALLPNEELLYFADSKHAPYGAKSQDYIIQRSLTISRFLLQQGAKAIVVACNTATAAAVQILRNEFPYVPIIGMEPAVKPAAMATRSGVVGVLATTGTLKSAQFAALLENYGRHIKVVTQACVGLVERVEQGDLTSEVTRDLVKGYVLPLIGVGADTLVLGCTHYPFVAPLISEFAGSEVTLIDTGAAVANQLKFRLQENELLSSSESLGEIKYWSNSEIVDMPTLLKILLGEQMVATLRLQGKVAV